MTPNQVLATALRRRARRLSAAALAALVALTVGTAATQNAWAADPAPSASSSVTASASTAASPSASPSSSIAPSPSSPATASASASAGSSASSAPPAGSATPSDTAAAPGDPVVEPIKPLVLAPLAGPAATGSVLAGTPCAPTCDLYAKEGTLNLPGLTTAVPIWSFTATDTDPVVLPGATLVAVAGTNVQLTLHNELSVADGPVALEIPGLAGLAPDLVGVPSGGSTTYTLTAQMLQPGTYLYQAGETANGPRQQAMGLSGLLVVRPADFDPTQGSTWTAYGANTGSTFTTETLAQVSEIDPAFNADPNNSDLVEYDPTEFLLNGRPFDPTDLASSTLDVNAGDSVLVRYADLGLREHSMGVLGLRQRQIGWDSQPLTHQQDSATVFLTPGQVTDAIVGVDPAAVSGQLYPVYDAGFHFNNAANPGLGGIMAQLHVVTGAAQSGGPVTTNVTVSPAANDGTQDVTVTAHIVADPGHQVTGVEWFLDAVRLSGTGFSGAGGDALVSTVNSSPGLPAPAVDVSITIPAASLDAYLAAQAGKNGDHTIWVHAIDETSSWGTASGGQFILNLDGPIVSALTVEPTSTNTTTTLSKVTLDGLSIDPLLYGAVDTTTAPGDVVLQGTVDSSLPGWDAQAAEYCIDYSGPDTGSCPSGAGGPVALVPGPGSVAALAVVIPAAQLAGLAEGVHHVFVRAHEAPTGAASGRDSSWNAPAAEVAFAVDRQGPHALSLSLTPNPNDGYQSGPGNLGFLDSLEVVATVDDSTTGGSALSDAEVFVATTVDAQNQPLPDGSGAEMVPSNGQWGSTTSQQAYAYIPLAVVRSFPEGIVRFFVHGKDSPVTGDRSPRST